ncbi:hypothetical protein SAMD00019534_019180 [Acytostelium subglobosum LB1]|uniref:hypothetical protein n=1 Tax=Acytostelium subglobosum LB1 TaxID=1410327 RepID=UPI000644AA15|nr:hypothetical protein SAMD00019534_019180 [Acytostelium subglobosum LB1]GAM18743.1 hypothetical protein SAMD00019534_019180 [Acytostelium subglobosum LB1]|eukprot:XP_012757963.1 hypothetical protein SAMD00019534_019180 [Acytostelium subglobosum LB1]
MSIVSNIVRRTPLFLSKTSSGACLNRAGEQFRLSNNRMRSGNEDGPLHDLPDFHFADGRPAPITEKQMKWQRTRENREAIINQLKAEVIAEQKYVTDKIADFQTKVDQKIKERREKKSQINKLFNDKKQDTSSTQQQPSQ